MKMISFISKSNRQSLLMAGAGLACSVLMPFSGAATQTGMIALPGHVPAIVARLQSSGVLPANTNLNLAIGLPLRNQDALNTLLAQICDPASTNYHRYLTPEQFTAQFGPTEADYQAVINFARQNGLTVTGSHPNRMLLDVKGKALDVQNAFHVTLHTYARPVGTGNFYAPDVDPSVPSSLPIQDVSGLDNYRRPHPNYILKSTAGISSNAVAALKMKVTPAATTGSGPYGNYIGDDFRNAYVPGTKLNGSGQTVALVQFDGYYASDIEAYEALAGRTNTPLQNILIDGFDGVPTGNGGEVEVSLDIEMVISMASTLSLVILYEGNPYDFIPNDVLNRIATDNLARQVSSSWGWSGGPSATTDQIFKQMAAQGQTFYNAVGDSDAFTAGANSVNGVDNPYIPNAPSDSPYITQVGGTTLTMNGAGSSYASETVWNWGVRYGSSADGEGSSGGISSYYSIPAWQTNISMTASQGSTTFRNTPDIAMTADDVLVIADGGMYYPGTGGTSCAAPLWAGFTALANQQAASNGAGVVGFINPSLYAIAKSSGYTNCFHDITTGNNTWSQSPGLFYAVSGYDLCTGLGTPNGTNLINALTVAGITNPITPIAAPLPPYGSTLSALNGGNPNGSWTLFVQDDTPLDAGIISNGWYITLTTASPVGSSADLLLAVSASSSTVTVGGNLIYTIGVTNYGVSICSNAVVVDTLPFGVTLVGTNVTQGTATRGGNTVTWNVGTLGVNAGAQMTLTVQVNIEGSILNSADASASTPDPNTGNNYDSVTVTAGTSSPPQLSGVGYSSNGTFHFTVTSSAGQTNIVQASTNLVNWVPIYTNVGSFIFTDSGTTNYHYRFYRDLLIGP